MRRGICGLLCILAVAASAHADEFHLKDGSKIVGTIVGFEDGGFKVETSYGFAFVRKDNIAEIIPSEKKSSPDSSQPPAALKPAGFPGAAPTSKAAGLPLPKPASAPMKPAGMVTLAALPPMPATNPVFISLPAPPVPAPPAGALAPRSEPMQELVRGNLYVNQTYGFQMYKAPTWKLIKDSQNELPNAIGAMGTDDQNTLLVIGRDVLKDSMQTQAAATERLLRSVYENYRAVEKKQISVAGLPAIELRFYGKLDDHDWSVTVTTLARDKDVFTILGMTSANSDLIQIQENVIAKTIASFQFLPVQ
jgi:hypothetical protein